MGLVSYLLTYLISQSIIHVMVSILTGVGLQQKSCSEARIVTVL